MAQLVQAGQEQADEYRGDSGQPVGSHAAVMGLYGVLVVAAALAAKACGRELPEQVTVKDLLTMALGTHKLSRTITKDSVTAPIRAPFAQHEGPAGPAEVMDEPRHSSGVRHSIGELLTCPFCLDLWVVTLFTLGLVAAPRLTRLVVGGLSALAGADFLQLAYARAQQATES